MLTDNPANCELHVVIRFLNAKNVCLAEIHLQHIEVYGDNVMNGGNVCMWCKLFNEGKNQCP